mgnify:CR=1 FL=1
MDLVNFQVGAKTVALPILNILLTERYDKDLTELPNDNPSFIGVKDFMNLPVPVFDLGKILNSNSTSESNKALASKLHTLKEETIQWLLRIDANITNHDVSPIVQPEQTEYLKWLSNFDCDNEDLHSLLHRIVTPLKELYEFYKQSPKLSAEDQSWVRLKTSSNSHIQRLFDSAIEQVDMGYKPIIVFTTTDGREPHVGLLVDKVEDSLYVDESDIKSLDSVTSVGFQLDKQTTAMMQGLIQLENKHSLIIDARAIFSDI